MNKVRDVFLKIIHHNGFNGKRINSGDIIKETNNLLKEDSLSPWHGLDLDAKKELLSKELSSNYFKINGVNYSGNICNVKNIDDVANLILNENKVDLMKLLKEEIELIDSVFLAKDLFKNLINNNSDNNLFNKDIYWIDLKVNIFYKLLNNNKDLNVFYLNSEKYVYNKRHLLENKNDLIFYIINLLKDSTPMSIEELYDKIKENPYYFALLNVNKEETSNKTNNEILVLENIVKPNKLIKKRGGKLTLDNDLKKILNNKLKDDIESNFNLLKETSKLLLINKNPIDIDTIAEYFSNKYKGLDKTKVRREISKVSEDLLYKEYNIHKFNLDNKELYIHKDNCEYITNNSEYILKYVKDLMEEFLNDKKESLIYPMSNYLKNNLTEEFKSLSINSILVNDIIKKVVVEMLNRDMSIDNLKIDLDRSSIKFIIDEGLEEKRNITTEEHPLTNSLKAYMKNELMILKDKKEENKRSIEELTLYDEKSIINYYQYHNNINRIILKLKKLNSIS